jgi:hypothetical protein
VGHWLILMIISLVVSLLLSWHWHIRIHLILVYKHMRRLLHILLLYMRIWGEGHMHAHGSAYYLLKLLREILLMIEGSSLIILLLLNIILNKRLRLNYRLLWDWLVILWILIAWCEHWGCNFLFLRLMLLILSNMILLSTFRLKWGRFYFQGCLGLNVLLSIN